MAKKRARGAARLSIALVVLLLLALTVGPAFAAGGGETEARSERTELVFFSGPMGGAWYPLAGAAAEIIQSEVPGVTVEVQPGAGLVNMEAIQTGQAHIAMGNSPSTADGFAGREPFQQPTTRVRNLMNLYNLTLHLVVPRDSDIRSVPDFMGKRVSAQTSGETGEMMFRNLLQAYGMSYDDFSTVHHLSHGDSANLVRDRHADIMAATMNVPGPAIMELTMSRPMRLVPVDEAALAELRKINAGYVPFRIPAGSYPSQDSEILGVGMISHFMVSEDLDEELVYRITEALYRNIDRLQAVVSAIQTDLDYMTQDIGAPLHTGAERFFNEIR